MERSVKDLAKYRYECSLEALEDARVLYAAGRYKNVLNRSYYSIFYALRSVCALDGFDSSKHSGVIAYFNRNYVKTGIFPREASKLIKLVSEKRESADYLDFYVVSAKDAKMQMEHAEQFGSLVRAYLESREVL